MKSVLVDMSRGLPEFIDFGSHPDASEASDFSEALKREDGFFHVDGCCMEDAGIEDGGYVLVNFTRFPKPPRYKNKGGDGSFDCCLCTLMFPDSDTLCVKSYSGKWGAVHCVGTRYTPEHNPHPPFQEGLFAKKIFGAVVASYGKDGRRIWARELDEFADSLAEEPSIFGEGIGDPVVI